MEGRTIIVGDVHGCAAELADLFDQLAVGPCDRIVQAGDLIARGPDTRGVLAQMRKFGARCVLGNHEQRLLDVRAARRRGERGPRLGPGHERVFAELSDEDWAQLEALPLFLELPEHDVLVVHAGLAPGVPLSRQVRQVVTRIRSFDEQGQPTARYSASSWAATYEGALHVVFGHNAQLGLQLWPRATGLDTGCVYGERLTALVLEPGQEPPTDVEARRACLVSVPARAVYYVPN